jgi:hypothetical protein
MAVLGTACQDALLGVVGDIVNLVLIKLPAKNRLSQCEYVVLIALDVEHPDHIFAGYSRHEALARPNCVQQFGVARDSQLDLAVWNKLLPEI